MQSNHASALRGLSIAVVIIAGLSILACIIGAVFLGVGGSYVANMTPDMWEYYLYDGDYYDYSYGYDYYGFDGSDMAAVMALLIGFGGVALFWELALSVVGLIAGILGLRNYNNPSKLNLVFGWSLAGAIASFLCGSLVAAVLLVIMCVFAHKDKQLAGAQPVIMTQPAMPSQPVAPAQPVQPVAAAPVAAVPVTEAPVAEAQPGQPTPPVAPQVAQSTASETVTVEGVVTPTAVAEEVVATEETKSE